MSADQIVERAWRQFNEARRDRRDPSDGPFYVTYAEKEELLREYNPTTGNPLAVDIADGHGGFRIFGMRLVVRDKRYLVRVVAYGDDGKTKWGMQRLVFGNEVRFLAIIIDYMDAAMERISLTESRANWYWESREWT